MMISFCETIKLDGYFYNVVAYDVDGPEGDEEKAEEIGTVTLEGHSKLPDGTYKVYVCDVDGPAYFAVLQAEQEEVSEEMGIVERAVLGNRCPDCLQDIQGCGCFVTNYWEPTPPVDPYAYEPYENEMNAIQNTIASIRNPIDVESFADSHFHRIQKEKDEAQAEREARVFNPEDITDEDLPF